MHFNEATQDYKLMVFFVPGFFEDHEGTNETDYGINDRILYYYRIVLVIYHRLALDSCNLFLYRSQYLQLLVITYL